MLRYTIKLIALVLTLFSYSTLLQAQDFGDTSVLISGVVLDASSRQAIEGAKVYSHENASTFTNNLGEFTLKLSSLKEIITVSAGSYATKVIPLKGRSELEILLYENYYESFQREADFEFSKKPLMYATQAIESKTFENENWSSPGASADHLMKNNFAGLQTQTRSGVTANGALLTIRGLNSLHASNRPLIIVDGMISEFNSNGKELVSGAEINTLAGVNINDIEEITILKDASSIYGAQGGNGVIYIHTVQATEAKTRIEFSSYGGIKFQPENLPVMNSSDYKSLLSGLHQSDGISQDSMLSLPYFDDNTETTDYYRYHNETNWQDETMQDGIVKNFNLKIKGGDNIALYGISVGYQGNEGIIKNTDYQSYSIRFNTKIKISKRVSTIGNISWTSGLRSLNDDGVSPTTNPMHLSIRKAPFLHPYMRSAEGIISPNFEDADMFGVSNPVALADLMVADQRNNMTNASLRVDFEIAKGLKLSDRVGIMYYKSRCNTFVPHVGVADYESDLAVIENTMQQKVEGKYSLYNDLRLDYHFNINNIHNFEMLMGLRTQINRAEEDWAEAFNSPNDEMRSIDNGVNYLDEIGGYISNWNILTFYANVDYDFRKKYFLTAGFSVDGSSQYGDKAKGLEINNEVFGVFPSLTASWLLSSENFMRHIDGISIAKLRLGVSASGNNDIGPYSAQRYYSSYNLVGAYGLVTSNLYNPSLKWENNKKFNLGLDLGLFNDRLSIGVDFYRNMTEDMVTKIVPQYQIGYPFYLDNAGGLKTEGVDFFMKTRIINRGFKWDLGVNLSKYMTTITKYPGGSEVFDVYDGQVLVSEGEEIGLFYGYKTKGVYVSDAEAQIANLSAEMPNSDLIPFSGGDVIFSDKNNDNIINEKDRQVIGNPTPDLMGTAYSTLSWKGLSLDVAFGFSLGNDIYNHLRQDMESMTNYDNQSQAILNRWRVQGQQTNVPKANYGDIMGNARFSDRWIEDGSYLRLREITMSYQLPLPQRWNQSVTIFATGQNLITFSNYLGLDPEFSAGDSPLVRGVDIGLTPQPKAVFAGIRIGL